MPTDPVSTPIDPIEQSAPAGASSADLYQLGAMSPSVMQSVSSELLVVPVMASLAGAAVDPSGATVEFAFVAIGALPADSDWLAGAWQTYSAYGLTRYVAAYEVSGFAAGEYDVWLRITDSSIVPVDYLGRLEIR